MCSGIGETWRLTGARRVAAGLDGVGAHAPRDLHQRRAGLGASVDPAGIDLRFSQWFARRLTPCAGWAARRYERGTVRARVHHGAARLSASSVGGSKLAPIVALPQRSATNLAHSRTRAGRCDAGRSALQRVESARECVGTAAGCPRRPAASDRVYHCARVHPAASSASRSRSAAGNPDNSSVLLPTAWGHGSAARRTSGQTSTVTAPGFRQPRHGSRRGPPDRSGQAMSR